MQLVVGLGNPGRKYEATRHNAGFWWVQELAGRTHAQWRDESKFHGAVARIADPACHLLMPSTFMNASGRAVLALANFYRIPPQAILVVHDELDLPPGTARLKKGGGTGGHNGLGDIAECLGTKDFWRLRIGIGHPRESGGEVIDFVLHPPRKEEAVLIEDSIERSLELWPLIASGDMEGAMLRLHSKPGAKAPKPRPAPAGPEGKP